MVIDPCKKRYLWQTMQGLVFLAVLFLTGCGTGPLIGIVYTNVKLPMTYNLHETPALGTRPCSDRILEIKEPLTGAGLYTRINTNAIGEIARKNGIETLHFADQEIFSILGVWKTHRVFLHGKPFETHNASVEAASGQ